MKRLAAQSEGLESWKMQALRNLGQISSGGTPDTKNGQYWNGSVNWCTPTDITALNGSKYIGETVVKLTEKGLKNSSATLLPVGALIVCTRASIGNMAISSVPISTNQGFKNVVPKHGVSVDFLFYSLAHNKKQLIRIANGSTFLEVPMRDFGRMEILMPPLPEQKAIAQVLGAMDELISKTNRLIAQKNLRKKYLTQTLLTGKKRLKGFRKKWKTYPFRELATESVFRNAGKMSNDRLMAVYKAHGMIPMRERVQGESNHRCKVVRQNYFAYNPMRLNIGSLARWDGEDPAMVSGDYVVFKCEEERLDPRFFDFYRSTNEWANYVRRAGDGSVRVRIYFSHLSPLKIKLPSIEEQKAIANILDIATCEVTMLETKAELLKMQKRWLMQQLLTGKRRLKLEEE